MKRDLLPELVIERIAARPRSLRIAVVTETYPPEVNGVAMSIQRIVSGLHARRHEVQLVRPRQPGHDAPGSVQGSPKEHGRAHHEVLTASWPVPRYPSLRMGVPCQPTLVRLWSLQRPEAVHIATEGPLGWSALQAARHLALPVTSDFRTNFHAYGRHYGASWLTRPILGYLRKFHNRAHCTMVPTDALRVELAALGFERLHVVGRGVDTALFNPARRDPALRAAWGAGPDDLVAAYVGRLAAEKNLDTLLAAYAALRQAHPDAKLLLVGDGPMRDELKARCPQAICAGHRGGADLAAHYASADLFLFPSLTETFGNVTTEAMASGLPVVAFDLAAARQWITHGRNGVLAAQESGESFVCAALSIGADRARRAALGAAARTTAEGIAWDSVVARFESIVTQTVDCHLPPVTAPAPPAAFAA